MFYGHLAYLTAFWYIYIVVILYFFHCVKSGNPSPNKYFEQFGELLRVDANDKTDEKPKENTEREVQGVLETE
jgi:hypothetical protein